MLILRITPIYEELICIEIDLAPSAESNSL